MNTASTIGENLRLLIVEDNNLTRVSLADTCALYGVTVVGITKTANEAIHSSKLTKPNVALLDLDLGEGPTGIDLAWGLRRLDPQIGLVLLTSYADPRLTGRKFLAMPNNTKYLVKHEILNSEILIKALYDSVVAVGTQKVPDSRIKVTLTDNEILLLRKVWEGKSNSEISKVHNISVKSVENAIRRISKKIDIPYSSESNQRILLAKFYQGLIGKIS